MFNPHVEAIHVPDSSNHPSNVRHPRRQPGYQYNASFRTGRRDDVWRTGVRLEPDYSYLYPETTWYEPPLTPTFTATYVPSTRHRSRIWSGGGLGAIITISFVALAIFAFFPLLLI